eukprot:TRINITY_DN13688_c0_g1_i1.p1 TRINITY_DN13688_c0_g1~~TRINITY_DN13688_c0_g1_i1.p1  ORF type:complete len:885 (+),score=288.92 TRINITY_DN13688_c0_g1_i1:191-2656(+)
MGVRSGAAASQTFLDTARLALECMLRPGTEFWGELVSRRVRVLVVDGGAVAACDRGAASAVDALAGVYRRSMVFESMEFMPNTKHHAQAYYDLLDALHHLRARGASRVHNALSAVAFAMNARLPQDHPASGDPRAPMHYDSYPTGFLAAWDPLNTIAQSIITVYTAAAHELAERTTPALPSALREAAAPAPDDVLHWKQLVNVVVLRRMRDAGCAVGASPFLQAAQASGGVIFDLPVDAAEARVGGDGLNGAQQLIHATYKGTLRGARVFFTASVALEAPPPEAAGGGLPPSATAPPPAPATAIFYPFPETRTTWPLARVGAGAHPVLNLRHSGDAFFTACLAALPCDRYALEAGDTGTPGVRLWDSVQARLARDGGVFVVEIAKEHQGAASMREKAAGAGPCGVMALQGGAVVLHALPPNFVALAGIISAGAEEGEGAAGGAAQEADPSKNNLLWRVLNDKDAARVIRVAKNVAAHFATGPPVFAVAAGQLLRQYGDALGRQLPLPQARSREAERTAAKHAEAVADLVYRCATAVSTTRNKPPLQDEAAEGVKGVVTRLPALHNAHQKRKRKWSAVCAQQDASVAAKLMQLRERAAPAENDWRKALMTHPPSSIADAHRVASATAYRDKYYLLFSDTFPSARVDEGSGSPQRERGHVDVRRSALGAVAAVQLSVVDANYHCHPSHPSHRVPVHIMSDQNAPPRRGVGAALRELPTSKRPAWLVNNHASSKFKRLKASVLQRYEAVDPRTDHQAWMASDEASSSLPTTDVDGLSVDGLFHDVSPPWRGGATPAPSEDPEGAARPAAPPESTPQPAEVAQGA